MKTQKLLSALLSGVTALSALTVFPASALDPLPQQPDWVPTDRRSAVDFLNQHGATHVADGTVCIVRRLEAGDYSDVSTHDRTKVRKPLGNDDLVYGTLIDCESGWEFCDTVFTYEIPEDPGEYDGSENYDERRAAYEEYLRGVEMYGEETFTSLPAYEVIAFMPQQTGEFEVELQESRRTYAEQTDEFGVTQTVESGDASAVRYTFELSADGTLAETDELAWLPDCAAEFDAYKKENGSISVHDNLVVVCKKVNYSTGAEIFFGQNGTPCTQLRSVDIGYEREISPVAVGGDTTRTVELWQATKAGKTQFALIVARPWDMEHIDDEDRFFFLSDIDGEIREDLYGCTACDLDADGWMTVSDAVLLAKFLTAQIEFNTAQMLLADYNNDRKVNAVDLSLLKTALMTVPVTPPPVIIDDPIVIDDPIYVIDDPIVTDEPI